MRDLHEESKDIPLFLLMDEEGPFKWLEDGTLSGAYRRKGLLSFRWAKSRHRKFYLTILAIPHEFHLYLNTMFSEPMKRQKVTYENPLNSETFDSFRFTTACLASHPSYYLDLLFLISCKSLG